MKNAMTFETIDWQLEAERLRRAFGITIECQFVPTKFANEMEFVRKPSSRRIKLEKTFNFKVTYSLYGRTFELWKPNQYPRCEIVLKWNNRIIVQSNPTENSLRLAHGLFHLDLLSPEVEDELEVTITAHERMEWAREHEERMKL